MADRGRDLKVSILSDVDKFDADQPARDLDKLADKADDAGKALKDLDGRSDDAGRNLRRLGDHTDTSGRSLDKLATDAKATAGKVDSAFEKIAASSKSNLRKVDDATSEAGDKVGEMSGEIRQEALEGAASFDGSMDSIKDSAQSAAANALAAFGPLGAGIGVAAATGFGFFRAQAEKAKEAVNALVGELIQGNGRISNDSVISKVQELAQSGDILDLAKQARAAKIDVGDFIAAVAGDPDAMERSTRALQAHADALTASEYERGLGIASDGEQALGKAVVDAGKKLEETSEQTRAAAKAYDAMAQAIDPAKEAQDAFTQSLGDFTDPLGVYTDLLGAKEEKERQTAEKTAEATKSQKDSWQDYVKDAEVSIGEYNAALARQVKAQEEWAGNMATLAKRGVDEGVLAELAKMGPEAAPLVAGLATATKPELAKWESLMKRRAEAGAQKFADGIEGGKPAARTAAASVHSAVVDAIKGPANVKVGVTSAGAIAAAQAAHASIQSYFYRNPVTVAVNPKPGQGQGYGVVRPRP